MPTDARNDSASALPALPLRDPKGHKGTFGTVAVVGGCARGSLVMLGGPCLAAIAALRAGAGLARLALPQPILAHGLTIAPSATGRALPVDAAGDLIPHAVAEVIDDLLEDASCIIVGPGLGVSPGAAAVSLRAVNQDQAPAVVDADALNNLARTPDLPRDVHASAILTPHPGEFRRLAPTLGIRADPTAAGERPAAAEALAQKLGCVVALKGAATVVSDGQRTWVHSAADAALATAGTGDVLSGLIAGLVAQFHKPPLGAGAKQITSEAQGGVSLFDCARLGVAIHADAANLWRQRAHADAGMLASELADAIPQAVAQRRGSAG